MLWALLWITTNALEPGVPGVVDVPSLGGLYFNEETCLSHLAQIKRHPEFKTKVSCDEVPGPVDED